MTEKTLRFEELSETISPNSTIAQYTIVAAPPTVIMNWTALLKK